MAALDNRSSSSSNSDLQKRIFFTLAMLAVYRIGVHVPTPGIDGPAVLKFFESQSRGIFGLFNTFTGGALSQFSVFALGIMPYISASIIFQLLSSAIPYLESLKKEGEHGRRKINQYTRYATVGLAIVQGYGISQWLDSSPQGTALVLAPFVGFLPFKIMAVITLVAGTCFIMWLGEQITERGIGNGSSLIIFTGIAASIPSGASRLFQLVSTDQMKFPVVLIVLAFMVVVIAGVIFMEVAQRRITIQYSQRGGGGGANAMAATTSHLPIKVNFSGVIPPIFASSLLMFPATMAQFVQWPWLSAMQDSLNPAGTIYNIFFVGLIVFFSFFYTEIVFNPTDVAENLKKHGGFIPGVRAGKSTAEYIQKVLERVNVAGCVYLSIVCTLPVVLSNYLNLPFYFGGTSLLILVGVALDTSQQIQSHLITQKYEGFLKGAKIRSRRVQF